MVFQLLLVFFLRGWYTEARIYITLNPLELLHVLFCFVIFSCNSFYPVNPVTQYILQRQFYTQYFKQGADYRIQNTGAVYKILQGHIKNCHLFICRQFAEYMYHKQGRFKEYYIHSNMSEDSWEHSNGVRIRKRRSPTRCSSTCTNTGWREQSELCASEIKTERYSGQSRKFFYKKHRW